MTALAGMTACAPRTGADLGDYGFKVKLTVSPAAKAKLAAAGKGIQILAVVSGEALHPIGWHGRIGLGNHLITVTPSDQMVVIPDIDPDPRKLVEIKGKPTVIINAWSTRAKDTPIPVTCSMFSGPVDEARSAPPAIHCKLTAEDQPAT
ncbi:hypothetical protein [Asticcacaulis sp. AC460]|uniref:hypothetical protein n=1 Tax=Asticcacaulis sp. AC460 TaxID=1282360 RepID=UPI00041B05EA|nr:hypothetical protein [Asticcacaulis sp. AC460]